MKENKELDCSLTMVRCLKMDKLLFCTQIIALTLNNPDYATIPSSIIKEYGVGKIETVKNGRFIKRPVLSFYNGKERNIAGVFLNELEMSLAMR